MGTVYLNVIQREGMNAMLRKVLRRAGFLYVLTVSLTILFGLLSYLMDTAWSRTMTPTRPLEFVLSVVTLRSLPGRATGLDRGAPSERARARPRRPLPAPRLRSPTRSGRS